MLNLAWRSGLQQIKMSSRRAYHREDNHQGKESRSKRRILEGARMDPPPFSTMVLRLTSSDELEKNVSLHLQIPEKMFMPCQHGPGNRSSIGAISRFSCGFLMIPMIQGHRLDLEVGALSVDCISLSCERGPRLEPKLRRDPLTKTKNPTRRQRKKLTRKSMRK